MVINFYLQLSRDFIVHNCVLSVRSAFMYNLYLITVLLHAFTCQKWQNKYVQSNTAQICAGKLLSCLFQTDNAGDDLYPEHAITKT